MDASKDCPVRVAIDRIYAGGTVDEYGGVDPSPTLTIAYGDMRFLATCKMMSLARFKLTAPSLGQCLARFVLPAPSPQDYYRQVAWSPCKQLFTAIFVKAVRAVKKRAMCLPSQGQGDDEPLAVSIPPPVAVFSPQELCLDPSLLHKAVTWVVEVAQGSRPKHGKKGTTLPPFAGKFPAVSFPEIPDSLDSQSALAYLDAYQEVELAIIDYAAEVEAYQAESYAVLEGVLAAPSPPSSPREGSSGKALGK